jgi:hypothetical protein
VSSGALSLSFFDPAHGLFGTARAGATLLFDGPRPELLGDGPVLEAGGGGFSARLEGRFELRFEPVAESVELGGTRVTVCAVTGEVDGREVDCLGTAGETNDPPAWDQLDALRSVSALFDRDHAFLALARRPRGALGHGQELVTGWLLHGGELLAVEEARISTVYDADGRQRSAGLELWLPGEEFPRRGSGTVVAGSSMELEGLDVHAAIFRWRMEDREGSGAYELMARADPQAAA